MLVGIGFVAILTGAIAERFLAHDIERETETVEDELDEASVAILSELRDLKARLADVEAIVRRHRA